MSSRPISAALYQLVAHDAQFQCGYCRCPQEVLPYRLEIEHLLPSSLGPEKVSGTVFILVRQDFPGHARLQTRFPFASAVVPLVCIPLSCGLLTTYQRGGRPRVLGEREARKRGQSSPCRLTPAARPSGGGRTGHRGLNRSGQGQARGRRPPHRVGPGPGRRRNAGRRNRPGRFSS